MLAATILTLLAIGVNAQPDLPTIFEHYRAPGNVSGLTAESDGFKLNGLPIRIISGSIHYFRVHPDLWRDRLKRLRATGANAVDTYVSWNLHEPEQGNFDFGDGNNDMSMFLNLRKFIQIAQEEDLLVVFRPGPYICSEFEFGGMPSWLLRDPDMRVRSNYIYYMTAVISYFGALLPLVQDLQWSNGGPIIMVQIENEFGGFGTEEKEHLESIKSLLGQGGIRELLFTSDSPQGARDKGAIPGVLQTANFRFTPGAQLDILLELQPDKPIYVAEFWSGWFDYWFHPYHSHVTVNEFKTNLETILSRYNGSVNFYMFHGGTDFGFLNGANTFLGIFPYYRPIVSSYDYNAPLSESGRYTDKYDAIRELVEQYKLADIHRPDMPPERSAFGYGNLPLTSYLTYSALVDQVPANLRTTSPDPISMENLDINNKSGQSYGLIIYRKTATLGEGSVINITRPRDELSILVDGDRKTKDGAVLLTGLLNFGYWTVEHQHFTFELPSTGERTLDLLVENWGRVNFGGPDAYHQQKGLFNQTIVIDGEEAKGWELIPLEFKSNWVRSLENWEPVTDAMSLKGPLMIQSEFEIEGEPQDTFIDMSEWYKGNVFVNGFNIGRYYRAGPTKTMFIAAPFLKTGKNTITIFELFQAGPEIVLTAEENLGIDSPI